MKIYKSNLPQIFLSLRKGETLKQQIKTSADAVNVFRQIWDKESIDLYESAICLFLNNANNTIGWLKVSQGGLSGTVIDARLILVTALNCAARGILLAHNHPNSAEKASESDIKITDKLKEACKFMDITLLDHVIISGADDGFYSFADNGLI